MRANVEVVVCAPLRGVQRWSQGGIDRAAGGRHAPLGPADVAAPLVALVELVADDLHVVAVPGAELLVEEAHHVGEGMKHQPPPDQAAAVGQAVRVPGPGREQEQPGRADPVRGQHDDLGLLDVLAPVLGHVLDACCQPARAEQHPARRAPR